MGIKPIIKAAHRLGPKTIVVALGSEDEKLEVMHNKSKLRNRPGNKVFIEDDLTKEEREIASKSGKHHTHSKKLKKTIMDGPTRMTRQPKEGQYELNNNRVKKQEKQPEIADFEKWKASHTFQKTKKDDNGRTYQDDQATKRGTI
ncbi:hypothetical protein QE152_g24455 [Popillia japonica]|uniref:Uncharacterized protein n=1 Tax=Popillia japonica TaxID=7064 RepID=A0AAW1KFF2_POPJA